MRGRWAAADRSVMRSLRRLTAALFIVACTAAPADAARRGPGGERPPSTCAALAASFAAIAAEPDAGRRAAAVDTLWADLCRDGRVPFVAGDSVVFLFRGEASGVAFPGDANGWDPAAAPAVRVPGTDVWARVETFPRDARLDYKIVTDGKTWLMDPVNPHRQRGGFGDNSELRMPDWRPSPWTVRRDDGPHGQVIPATIRSEALGATIAYSVYVPAGFDSLGALPVIYVTDGHEYADPAMGAMVEVLDNLIAAGRLRPIAAVFIDPRIDGANRRADQYIMNEDFVRFVARELVPAIDSHGRTSRDRRDRAILGTSLGGLNAAWFAAQAPDVFGRIAIMSPAFQAGDGRILAVWRDQPRRDLDLVLTWGTFADFGEHTRRFIALLDDHGYAYRTIVTHEGHSWGQWRALLDDILTVFWPGEGAAR